MIRSLTLKDTGPARELAFEFAPRLNVLTGDNGLGKTFALDVIWWVLTTTWAGEKAFPWRAPATNEDGSGYGGGSASGSGSGDGEVAPMISAVVSFHHGDSREHEELVTGGVFRWQSQDWERTPWQFVRRPTGFGVNTDGEDEASYRPPSLVIYARIDGTCAIWDSHYVKGGIEKSSEAAIVLEGPELWDGKEVPDPEVAGGKRKVIAGLIADWVNWQQRSRSPEFEALRRVLATLSSPEEPLVPAEPTRVHLRDRRDIPTLAMSYGVTPVSLASAGVRRVISLAYLIVWAWTEHTRAAKQSRRPATRDMVLLIDEPELHLHPSWQRMFLPAVLKAIGTIAPNVAVQVFAATHSPMVLASLESIFREGMDDLFVMERDGRVVRANEFAFGKEGDVSNWLSSEVFGGVGGRSREATLAIDAAMDFMADRHEDAERNLDALRELFRGLPSMEPLVPPDMATFDQIIVDAEERRPLTERIHDALVATLPDHDPFWPRWIVQTERGMRRRGRKA